MNYNWILLRWTQYDFSHNSYPIEWRTFSVNDALGRGVVIVLERRR